jgi:hypothetical protein
LKQNRNKMKKFSLLISTLLLTATLVFTLSGFLSPQTAYAQAESGSSSESNPCSAIMLIPGNGEGAAKCFGHLVATGLGEQAVKFSGSVIIDALGWVSVLLLQFFNLILGLGGVVLNLVVGYTVVHMADNIKAIGVIDNAWQTIRDVANIGFIFILLYASIQLILGIGKDVQRLIVNIIIVAVLINFSLFFTKLVIDVSNVMAVTFYGAMAPEALDVGSADLLDFDTDLSKKAGLANSMMEPLKLNSIFDAVKTPALDSNSLIIIGVAGSILALVAAFVFFAISIMLIIRFVVLIFVMILSPIAFMAMILPALNKYSKQWWQALSGQAFFAPVYFMLTWIVIQLARGLPSWGGGTLATAFLGEQSTVTVNGVVQQVPTMSLGGIGILMNFIIIIAFLLASLMISKEWAGKAGPMASKATGWLTGKAGGLAFGGAAKFGKGTVGWAGDRAAGSVWLQEQANRERTSRVDSMTRGAASRLALYASKKARSGSFDPRRAAVPTSTIGDLAQGTVGRTRFGRKLGLDDVNIGNIEIGQFAASQTGVGQGKEGGYKERKEEKEKRISAREKATSEEFRKVEAQSKIKKSLSAGATPAEILEMQRVVKDMSSKEIVALDANTLANEKVAEALTANHLKAIDDDKDKFSEAEKRAIFEKHFAKVADAVDRVHAGTATNDDKNLIKNISEKELSYIPTSIFDPTKLDTANTTLEGNRSRAFLKAITQGQADNLTKGDKYIASEKQAIKTERSRRLEDAFAGGNWVGTPDSAVELMREMRPEAIVLLDNSKLINPNIFELYSPALLNKMAARSELTEGKALAIRDAIINAGPGVPGSNQQKAYDWLLGDGLNIF